MNVANTVEEKIRSTIGQVKVMEERLRSEDAMVTDGRMIGVKILNKRITLSFDDMINNLRFYMTTLQEPVPLRWMSRI